jgi:hypothetical protein
LSALDDGIPALGAVPPTELWTTAPRQVASDDDASMLLRALELHGVFLGTHAIAEGSLTKRQLGDGPYVRVLRGCTPTRPSLGMTRSGVGRLRSSCPEPPRSVLVRPPR